MFVTDPRWPGLFKRPASAFGPPFGLVNCAGLAVSGVLAMMPDRSLDDAIATNLRGTLILTRRVIRQMRLSEQGGSIVNISSVVGLRGYRGMAVYGATKGALDAMTRALPASLVPGRFASIRWHPGI